MSQAGRTRYFARSATRARSARRGSQALLSSAHRGFAARSRVLERLASLAQIGERAHWLDYMIRNGPVGQAGLFCLVATLAWSVL